MTKSDLSAYLSAFVTIVLAIAITDMIQSTHRLIRARKRIAWDARPLALATVVALSVVSEFFALYSSFAVDQIAMAQLLWLLATPTVLALLAYSVLPDEIGPGGLDLSVFYREERRVLAFLFGLATVFDSIRTAGELARQGTSLARYALVAGPFVATIFAGLAVIWFAQERLWSWVGIAIVISVGLIGVFGWTITAA